MATVKTPTALQQLLDELDSYQPGSLIYCRLCQHAVTDQDSAMDIGLAHLHSFTNPTGILYTIRCFHAAPGCAISGQPTTEHSWFGGYRWQYANCSHCYQHLGWYYEGRRQRNFFGLIANRLLQADSADKPG